MGLRNKPMVWESCLVGMSKACVRMDSMTPIDPIVEAWHALFRTADVEALEQALRSGAVPSPCVSASGNDLLTTVLCRPLTDQGAPVAYFGASHPVVALDAFRKERRQKLETLVEALLERDDIARFEKQDISAYKEFSQSHASPVDLALGWGLTRQVLDMFQHSSAPHGQEMLAWNEDLSGQPGTPGRRTQLAVAIGRNQTELVQWLVLLGLPLNQADAMGETPVFAANRPDMLKTLLDLGADLSAHTSKISPAEHWGKQMRGLPPHEMQPLKELVELAGRAGGFSAAHPVIHLQSNSLKISLGSRFGDATQLALAGENDWNVLCSRMPRDIPAQQWVRQQPSGPWKGTISPLAQVGLNLLSASKGEFSFEPAFIDLSPWVENQAPILLRKGVSDRGLFALGAARYFNTQKRAKQDHSGRWLNAVDAAGKAHVELVEKGAEKLSLLLSKHPIDAWHAWMVETTLVVQRPQDDKVRELMSDAWVHRLDLTLADGTFAFGSLAPQDKPIDAPVFHARRLMEQGIRFMGESWARFLSGRASEISKMPAGERWAEAAHAWAELALGTFGANLDAMELQVSALGTLCSSNPRHTSTQAVRYMEELVRHLSEVLNEVDETRLMANPVVAVPLKAALPVLVQLEKCPPKLRAMAISEQLPAAAPARFKPRF